MTEHMRLPDIIIENDFMLTIKAINIDIDLHELI